MRPNRRDPPYLNYLSREELVKLRAIEVELHDAETRASFLALQRRHIITMARGRSYYQRPPA
jgi:uncharacterized glyoxalase superfamily metalloenzyme YdcJ